VAEILVLGASGLVGSAVVKKLEEFQFKVFGVTSKDADLRSLSATRKIIELHKPKGLIIAAAKVGGINFNKAAPVEFLTENLEIQNNSMRAAHEAGVKTLIFLGSSCIYPKLAQQPIKEDYLMTGHLESSNSAYAVAKIAGIELVNSYRREYGHNWMSLMPTNIYGPNDNFNLETAHVIPALIRKFVQAKVNGETKVEVWGTGNARREFLFSEDLAEAIVFTLRNYTEGGPLNIGSGSDLTIRELALLIAELTGFQGEITFNPKFPDGTPRKLLDISKVTNLGWKARVSLREGLIKTIDWYKFTFERGFMN
jgi:GDP-L-fucose synthase